MDNNYQTLCVAIKEWRDWLASSNQTGLSLAAEIIRQTFQGINLFCSSFIKNFKQDFLR